jgi:phosphoribosylamine-glycine ligase
MIDQIRTLFLMEEEKKKIFLKEVLKEFIGKRLYERGMRCETPEITQTEKTEIQPDLIIKSSGFEVGKVIIVLDEKELDFKLLKSFADKSKSQIYLAVEKGKEKNLMSELMNFGLGGKIKFILWEFRLY